MSARPFSTVLVANRGEIARRIFRSAHAMGIRTVAVYVDADAHAPFVGEADEAVRIASYLDGASLVEAAVALGAEGVHPGYGFLSENATFAAAVGDAGLVWIGPSPRVIAAMGDKLVAKQAAVDAGVPILPSSADLNAAGEIGFPILVKAAAGGGGKGMRVVQDAADLEEAVAAARREARSGFGDDRVFLERYVPSSRHIEIQILGDHHGGLVHLGERECSIQRRHQKIIEEAPSPIVDDAMRSAMGESALALARSLGYESAGTVEFLVDAGTREYFFLEVNTRLQVEHPVTEAVTGLDLVREQLRIAAGEPLGFDQSDVRLDGHAVEARLYAEDVAAGFLPATGTLVAFAPPLDPAVRWDSGVEAGSTVGLGFDPMLAKVIAHAPTRHEAAGRLALALERLHVAGVTTNATFLAACLRAADFAAGRTTTDFVAGIPTRWDPDDPEVTRLVATAALWLQGDHRSGAPVLGSVPSGWRNARLPGQRASFEVAGRTVDVVYDRRRDGSFELTVGPDTVEAWVHHWTPEGIDLRIGDRRASSAVTRSGDRIHVQAAHGTIELLALPRFPLPEVKAPVGGLVAPMPGVVVDVRVEAGDTVREQQVLVVLEAMKMEHHMTAPSDGKVAEVLVRAGDQVANGQLVLVLEEALGDGASEAAS